MIQVREATEADISAIREIFLATYGDNYAYPQFYDTGALKRMIHTDDTVLLVAEDLDEQRVVGTASVVMDIGAYADLVGEFGRLAVHPDARRRGIGKSLMEARIEAVRNRLHVGLVENRASHPYSQRISEEYGFAVVGFLPLKLLVVKRESVALYARYFGNALELRRNNPRIIPEVYPLAEMALKNCGLGFDAIVDDQSAPYPHARDFRLDELTTQGYATLLRFERGRVRHREIFGPLQLHYGLFKMTARHSNYLIAREGDQLVGAIGFMVDDYEKTARIFELITLSDAPVRYLFEQLERVCREELDVEYIEADVSAHATRMQRTLLELKFLPAAYVPAMVFHQVERLDTVKMTRLLVPFDSEELSVTDATKPLADVIVRGYAQRRVLPRIAEATERIVIFQGLNEEQVNRLACACAVQNFRTGETVFRERETDKKAYLILDGRIEISVAGGTSKVGEVGQGEFLGELSLLHAAAHSATATAKTRVEAAVLDHEQLNQLVRLRPDIGVIIYRNLASGLGEKLKRSDEQLVNGSANENG